MTAAHDRRLRPPLMTAVLVQKQRRREKDFCLKPPLMTAVFDRRS